MRSWASSSAACCHTDAGTDFGGGGEDWRDQSVGEGPWWSARPPLQACVAVPCRWTLASWYQRAGERCARQRGVSTGHAYGDNLGLTGPGSWSAMWCNVTATRPSPDITEAWSIDLPQPGEPEPLFQTRRRARTPCKRSNHSGANRTE
jgi:hypothetical protein